MTSDLDLIMPDNEQTALISFETQAADLTTVESAALTVAEALDYLYSVGADAGALDDIHNGASELVNAVDRLSVALDGTINLARAIREQREEIRLAHAEFKYAIEKADTSVPEVEEFWNIIEQENMNWLSYSFNNWGRLVDELITVTPLSEEESSDLVQVLGSEKLPMDHSLWGILRNWIARAKRAIGDERNRD